MDFPLAVPEKGGGVRMKRGWKIFWIVCGICTGIGLICCAAAFALGVTTEAIENRFPNGIGIVRKGIDSKSHYYYDDDDYDDDDYDDDDYDDDYSDDDDGDYASDDNGYYSGGSRHHNEDFHCANHTAEAVTNAGSSTDIVYGTGSQKFTGVNSIDVYMWGGVIEVDNASDSPDEIGVETDNISKRLGLRCYMDGNELKIETKKKVLGVKNMGGRIILHVPPNYRFQEMELSLVAGYLHVDDICSDEFSADVGAGEGVVENFTAAEADLECGAGSLTAVGTAERKIDIDCGVGEIVYTAGGREKDYNYKIDCGVGEIVCGEASYSGIGAEKTISNNAAKDMDISCGIGSVAVNFSEL